MKNCILTIILPIIALMGCDGDQNKSKCIKDPTAPGCPRGPANITSSEPKTWNFDKLTPSKNSDTDNSPSSSPLPHEEQKR